MPEWLSGTIINGVETGSAAQVRILPLTISLSLSFFWGFLIITHFIEFHFSIANKDLYPKNKKLFWMRRRKGHIRILNTICILKMALCIILSSKQIIIIIIIFSLLQFFKAPIYTYILFSS